MFRWSRNVPQNNDLGYNLGALLGGLWAKNYADRGAAKDNKSIVDLATFNPDIQSQQTTTTIPDNTGANVRQNANQGLLGGGLLGNTNFAPEMQNYAFNNTLQPTTQNAQTTNPMDAYSKENNPVTTTTKTLSLKDRKNEFNRQFGEQLKTMTPGALKQLGPQGVLSLRNQGLAQLESDYNTEQRNSWLDTVSGAGDYRSKLVAGYKLGVDPKLMKDVLDNGIKVEKWDNGAEIIPVGVDERNQRVIDLTTGQAIDTGRLQKQMSPEGKDASARGWKGLELTERGQDLNYSASMARAQGGGGISAGDQRRLSALNAVINQHENWLKNRKDISGKVPEESMSPYFKQAQQARQARDGMLFSEAGVQPQSSLKVNYTGDNEVDQYIDKAREAGMSEEWINEKVYQSMEYKKQRQQQSAANNTPFTSNDYLGF